MSTRIFGGLEDPENFQLDRAFSEKDYRNSATLVYEKPVARQSVAQPSKFPVVVPEQIRAAESSFDALITARRFHDGYLMACKFQADHPADPDAMVLLAQATWELRNSQIAIQKLQEAADLGAASARFHKVKAQVLRGEGKFKEAVVNATLAHQLDSEDKDAILGLAIATFLAGSKRDAVGILDRALEAIGDDLKLRRGRALIDSYFKPEHLDLNLFDDRYDADVSLWSRSSKANHVFKIQDIELTNHCPMKCIMCPRTHSMTRALGHMKFHTFQRIMDQWAAADPTFGGQPVVWLHHYGESLVHPEFDRFVKYGRSVGAPVGLSINPLILTPPLAERLLDSEPHTLWIALDGHDNESFQAIRGIPRAYDKSKANALRFLEMKVERQPKTRVEVIMINFPENAESIKDVTEFWSNVAGVDRFQPKPFTTWDGSVKEINKLNPSPDKMSARRACNFPWSYMSILYTGEVVACCYDYDGKYVLGNVNDQTLSEIWNGPKAKHLRASLSAGIVANKMCQNCSHMVSV